MPERIQLHRTKGWRKPPGSVKVDRTTRWGNPFDARVYGREESRRLFLEYLDQRPDLVEDARLMLVGLDLCCWCRTGVWCHAGEWLRIVNEIVDDINVDVDGAPS